MGTIDFQLACAGCESDLLGTDLDGACSHCGRGVGETINLAIVDSQTQLVGQDLSCVSCGYNLRTRPIGALCPECLASVSQSLRADDLRFSSLHWLRQMRGGVSVLLIAAIGLTAVFVIAAAVASLFGGAGSVLGIVAAVLLALCGGVGIFVVTSSEPRLSAEVEAALPSDRVRDTARIMVLATVVCVLAPICSGVAWLIIVGVCLALLCVAIGLACAMRCLRRIALRGRRPGLARLTTVLIWLLVSAGVCGGTAIGLQAIQVRRISAQVAARRPAARSAAVGPAAPTSRPTTHPVDAHTPVADGDAPAGAGYGSVPVTTVGTSGTTVTVTATQGSANVSESINAGLMMLAGLASCGAAIGYLASYVIVLIVLFKYRGLLCHAIAGVPSQAQ
jgi:hypothetical protein